MVNARAVDGRYVTDYQKFLEDLSTGAYVENSVDLALLDVDGKRLMCEALYLLGVMYLFLDLKIPGPAREALIVAYYRDKVGAGSCVRVVVVILPLVTPASFHCVATHVWTWRFSTDRVRAWYPVS
jgi:hypothetical protein